MRVATAVIQGLAVAVVGAVGGALLFGVFQGTVRAEEFRFLIATALGRWSIVAIAGCGWGAGAGFISRRAGKWPGALLSIGLAAVVGGLVGLRYADPNHVPWQRTSLAMAVGWVVASSALLCCTTWWSQRSEHQGQTRQRLS